LLNLLLRPPPEPGRRCRISAVETRPVRARSSLSRKVTGAVRSSGSRRMRDPVTTIASPSCDCCSTTLSLWTASVVWADAGVIAAINPDASAKDAQPKRKFFFI
jgi:hypothetical protein